MVNTVVLVYVTLVLVHFALLFMLDLVLLLVLDWTCDARADARDDGVGACDGRAGA